MEPITTIATALTAGNHIINILKATADGVKGLGKVELVSQLIEAQLGTMNLLQSQQQLFNENNDLKRKVLELNGKIEFQSSLTYRQPLYYAEGDGTPFCPRCWEADRKAIHLVRLEDVGYEGNRYWECSVCEQGFRPHD